MSVPLDLQKVRPGNENLTRRKFLRTASLAAAALLAAGCQSQASPGVYCITPQAPSAGNKTAQVAISQARDYDDYETIDRALYDMVDQLGGVSSLVKPGDRVAIKVNLTGGVKSRPLQGVSAVESFVTHPIVVRGLIRLLQAGGAREVFIVESVYEWESYTEWGYAEIAETTEAKLIDLKKPDPYTDFSEVGVGEASFIYPNFILNKLLQEVNLFISVAKMKNHNNAGVTHTMKNLFGIAPAEFYRLNSADYTRTGFHGQADQTRSRVPRVIVDLNRARPIHFSLIDGIKTVQGGEGPWIKSMSPIQPGVLVAGKNAVATDAVATAVMGFDPTANYPDIPFTNGDNHLNLACSAGLGTNHLEEIEVLGVPVETVRTAFTPCR